MIIRLISIKLNSFIIFSLAILVVFSIFRLDENFSKSSYCRKGILNTCKPVFLPSIRVFLSFPFLSFPFFSFLPSFFSETLWCYNSSTVVWARCVSWNLRLITYQCVSSCYQTDIVAGDIISWLCIVRGRALLCLHLISLEAFLKASGFFSRLHFA